MAKPTASSRLLAAVSVAQLGTGVAGMVVALRRRHPYHVFWMQGRADAIARDTILKGTALSAPVSNLLLQAAVTALMARRPTRGAARPLAGLGLAGAMAALGAQVGRKDQPAQPPHHLPGGSGRRRGSVHEGTLHGNLPYLAVGEGPPLLVFSGLTNAHANPTGLGRWLALQTLRPMARHFSVYAVNRKPGLPADATIGDLAGHYALAIQREFPGAVYIGGISTGGSIAQQFAIDHPHLVRRLVLVATACRLSAHGREVQRRFAELTTQGRLRRAAATIGPTLAATATTGRGFAVLGWLLGTSQRVQDPSDMLVTVAAEDVFDAAPQLHRITAPTLLVAGGRDRFYTPELFRETTDRIPGARLALYQGKGHAGVITHKPAIREIITFLRAGQQTQSSSLHP